MERYEVLNNCSSGHRRRSRWEEQLPPPLADKGGNGIKCPHFADLVEWCLQTRKKTPAYVGENVWNTTKKCVQFACNYFKNSSASGELPSPRLPVVLPPSQTFRRLLVVELWNVNFEILASSNVQNYRLFSSAYGSVLSIVTGYCVTLLILLIWNGQHCRPIWLTP